MGKKPHILVVGGGLAGCSVAWHLASEARVTVLEQGAGPGLEASAQNAGIVRLVGEDPLERALARRTQSLLEDPPEDFDGLELSRRVGGILALNRDRHALHDAAAHLREEGVRIEACDRPPDLAPALAGSPLPFAWYLPDARVADPAAMISGMLRGVHRHGGVLRPGTRVMGVLREAGRAVGVQTSAGPLHADAVVLATAAWSPELARLIGVDRPVTPLVRSAFASAPHPLSSPDHPYCWVDDEGIYIRPWQGGWLACPCDESVGAAPVGAGSTGTATDRQAQLTQARIARFFPTLGKLALTTGWTGLRTFAPDRRPVIGPDPEVDGLWWAASLGGYGLTGSIGVGEALADWLLGRDPGWLDRPRVSPGRPMLTRWPIYPEGVHGEARLIGA
jgi:D-arginine dehydrogenase